MDKTTGVVTDITKDKDSELQLQDMVNNVPTGISIYEVKNNIEVVSHFHNETYYKLLGYTQDEYDQKTNGNIYCIVHPDDVTLVKNSLQDYLSEKASMLIEIRILCANGTYSWFRVQGRMVRKNRHSFTVYECFSNINETRKAEKTLSQKDERLTQIIKSIPGGVAIYHLVDASKVKTEYVSVGLAKMCGYTRNEFWDLLKEDAMSNVALEDRERLTKAIENAISENQTMNIIYSIYKRDRSLLKIRLTANLIKKGDAYVAYGVHTVVTDYEQRLIQKQMQNTMILDRLDIAYFGWNRNESPYSSEQFHRYAISKVPLEQILMNSAGGEYVHPDDLNILHKFFADKNADDSKTTANLRMKMRDGSYRWTEILRFSEHDASGKLTAALGIFMDVDKEWIVQNDYLKEALKDAQDAKKSKEMFFSQMSHDMRTPLNGIIGLSRLMIEAGPNEEQKADLHSIKISAEFLLELINGILSISKLESGMVTLEPKSYGMAGFIDKMNSIIVPLCDEKKIDFQLDATQVPKSINIVVDEKATNVVFLNLLSNAVKYTPNGGKIRVAFENVKILDSMMSADVVIRDNGIGMTDEFQKVMFDPYKRETNSNNDSVQGTGLGLAIVKKYIDLSNSTISVKSKLNEFTEFVVHMKVPCNYEEQNSVQQKSINLSGRRVLLIEDHPINVEVAKRILEKKSIIVEVATDGLIGTEMFLNSKLHYYDAILMDIRMPKMNGIDATKRIREMSRDDAACIPIIAMSANAFDEDIKESIQAGMNAHLSKPIDPDMLYTTLTKELIQKN